jgi:RNA polymerase sigma-70 factor (ECF subfamily)
VPVGTVKSRCSRARARLAVLLGHLHPGNPGAPRSVSGIGPSHGTPDRQGATVPGGPRGSPPDGGAHPPPEGGGREGDPRSASRDSGRRR